MEYRPEDLVEPLRAALDGVVEGAAEDVEEYATALSVDLAQLAAAGDDAGVAEVQAQARALAETSRLRATSAGWEAFTASVGAVARFLVSAATKTI